MSRRVRVCSVAEVPVGEVRSFEVEGLEHPVAIYNDAGEILSTTDVCSHEYALLSEGWFEDGKIECSRHGSRFDIRTGRPDILPAILPVETYPVEVSGDEVLVTLPD
ncbi:MAG: non-heme iron oxygenase ferredoxin subunit [Candidatus Dormibacteria bacterium]